MTIPKLTDLERRHNGPIPRHPLRMATTGLSATELAIKREKAAIVQCERQAAIAKGAQAIERWLDAIDHHRLRLAELQAQLEQEKAGG